MGICKVKSNRDGYLNFSLIFVRLVICSIDVRILIECIKYM